MKCPNKKHPDWKANVSLVGETGAFQHYFDNNSELSRIEPNKVGAMEANSIKAKALSEAILSLESLSDKSEADFIDKYSENISRPLIERVRAFTGVNLRFVSNAEMNQYNADRGADYATSGVYDPVSNTAYLNIEHATLGTLVHEAFAHPFMLVLQKENPKLYDRLIEHTKAMPEVDKVIQERGYSEEIYNSGIEHFAYALESYFNDPANFTSLGDESRLNRFKTALKLYFDKFAMFLKDLFGLNDAPNLSRNLSLGQLADIILKSNTDYFYNSFRELTSTERVDARIPKDRTSDVSEIKAAFEANNNHMVFDEAAHTYTNKSTMDEYVSVSKQRIYQLIRDDFDKKGMTDEERLMADRIFNWSSTLGTAVHAYVEDFFNGKVFDNSRVGAILTLDVQRELGKILSRYRGKYDFISSEQRVYDHNKKIAGTIDLLLKDKTTGEIIQLDIKTKASNYVFADGTKAYKKDKSNFHFYKSTTFEYSDHDKHFFQQWSYKRMQELLGIKIDKIGIIPVEIIVAVDANDNLSVTGVKLSEELDLTDDAYFELSPYGTRKSMDIRSKVDAMLDLERMSLEQEFQTDILENLHKIAYEGIDILEKKLAKFAMEGDESEADLVKDALNSLGRDYKNPLASMYAILAKVNELLLPHVEAYNRLLKAHEAGSPNWDLNTMSNWRVYANSFKEFLDNVNNTYNSGQRQQFAELPGFDAYEFENLLNGTRNYISQLDSAYKRYGMDKMLDALEPYSKTIEERFWSNARFEYQVTFREKQKKDPSLKYDEDKAREHADKYVSDHYESIRVETRKFLKKQAELADYDVSFVYRFADTIFRSKDPIVGSMSSLYYNSYSEHMREVKDLFADFTTISDNFDKAYPASSFKNQQDLYDFMLEYDSDGHAYLVTDTSRDFRNEYEKKLSELDDNDSISISERYKAIESWLEKHAPYTEYSLQRMSKQKIDAIKKLHKEDKISKDELDLLIKNEESDSPAYIQVYMSQGLLNRDAYFRLKREFEEIEFKNRIPDAKLYKNEKYDAIMALPDGDAKKEMFLFISRVSALQDSTSPVKYKLDGRLPGIMKDTTDRLVDRQNVKSTLINRFKDKYRVREDEDTRGTTYMIGNELNESLETIPIYYTRQLNKEDQNFDLPTIYFMWAKSVMYRDKINKILPELEYIKYIVNTRGVKRQKNGKWVKNAMDSIFTREAGRSPQEESFITEKGGRLAGQVNDWFTAHIYRNTDKYLGDYNGWDYAKMLRGIQNATSTKVMGLNILSMFNNALMAEASQAVEVASGRIMDVKTYAKATNEYRKQITDIMGDIGKRGFKSKMNLALEYFGIFDHMAELQAKDKGAFKRLFNGSALHITTLIGEHEAQSRFLIGALMATEVFADDGTSLGNMWDNIVITEDNKLRLNPDISGDHNALMNNVTKKVLAASWEMHGTYHQFASNSLSMNAAASLLQQFRKWYVPGIDRRFGREHMNEFSGEMRSGYLRGWFNHDGKKAKQFFSNLAEFFGKARDEAKAEAIATELDWQYLSDVQKQAIIRGRVEVSMMLVLFVLGAMLTMIYDDEDYKKNATSTDKFFMNNFAYQVVRLRMEMMSYFNPYDTLSMIQSPAPSASLVTSYLGVAYQLSKDALMVMSGQGVDRYTNGKRSGDSKSFWKLFNQIPVLRQVYRFGNAEESLQALTK